MWLRCILCQGKPFKIITYNSAMYCVCKDVVIQPGFSTPLGEELLCWDAGVFRLSRTFMSLFCKVTPVTKMHYEVHEYL